MYLQTKKRRFEREEEKNLPLISSVIITAVISPARINRGTKTVPSLCFSLFPTLFLAERVRDNTGEEELEREQRKETGGGGVTARQTARKKKGGEGERPNKRQREDERLVFPTPGWFVTLEVRHISLGLPGALQECELLQQESASSASTPLEKDSSRGETPRGQRRTTTVCKPY